MEKSVSVIYVSMDGEDWANYIKKQLEDVQVNVHVMDLETERDSPFPFEHTSSSLVTIVVLTPAFMDLIREESTLNFVSHLIGCRRLLILLMGTTEETFNEFNTIDRFVRADDKKMTRNVIEYNHDWRTIEVFVCQWCEAEAEATEKKATRPKRSNSDEHSQFQLIPSSGRCEVMFRGRERILACF